MAAIVAKAYMHANAVCRCFISKDRWSLLDAYLISVPCSCFSNKVLSHVRHNWNKTLYWL